MCSFIASDVEILLCGIWMTITDDVLVEIDPSDGRVSELYVGLDCLTRKPDAAGKALHSAIVDAIEGSRWRDKVDDALAEWAADEPNREADYRRARSY